MWLVLLAVLITLITAYILAQRLNASNQEQKDLRQKIFQETDRLSVELDNINSIVDHNIHISRTRPGDIHHLEKRKVLLFKRLDQLTSYHNTQYPKDRTYVGKKKRRQKV